MALAFVAVVLLLDPLIRHNPAMRLRAHSSWSVNPLLLWEIVATLDIDGLAIAFGLAGLVTLRFTADGVRPTLVRCAAAGTLLAAAACTKSPYVFFLVAALWTVRRSPARIACLLGGFLGPTLTLATCIAGMPVPACPSLRGQQVTWDNLYQLFYLPSWHWRAAQRGERARAGSPVGPGLFIGVVLLAFFLSL